MKPSTLSSIAIRGVIPAVLIALLSLPMGAFAQAQADDHIVSSQAMEQQVQLSSAERQKDIATVTEFLRSGNNAFYGTLAQ
jgi:hypothetical protein